LVRGGIKSGVKRRWYAVVAVVLVVDMIGLAFYVKWQRNHRYDHHIRAAAQRYGVDAALVKAMVWRESRFDETARGGAGEIGLMQIRDLAAREWAADEKIPNFDHEHIIDPGSNTLAGTWYLAKMLRRYRNTDDPIPFALADYNAGRTKVREWLNGAAQTNSAAFLEAMTYPGTKDYIRTIMADRQRFRRDFPVIAR
jgi:soluble lytic murein transglycosylase